MEQQVNLFQPILGAEKRLFSAHTIAVAIAALALCLTAITVFARWRTVRIERTVVAVSSQEVMAMTVATRANAVNTPQASLAELDAQARRNAGEITAREHALEVVMRGSADAHSGFAARLAAIGRSQLEGVWLTSLVLATGDERLALGGAATDPRLISPWLASLEGEPALDGAHFDRMSIKQVVNAAPANAVFEIGAPGLDLPTAGGAR